jgi:hypothetical protein
MLLHRRSDPLCWPTHFSLLAPLLFQPLVKKSMVPREISSVLVDGRSSTRGTREREKAEAGRHKREERWLIFSKAHDEREERVADISQGMHADGTYMYWRVGVRPSVQTDVFSLSLLCVMTGAYC